MADRQSNAQRFFTKPTKLALIALAATLSASSTHAFQQPFHQPSFVRAPTVKTPSTALSMTLEDVNSFYQTYPLQAAVLTCGVKASFADVISQVRSWSESENAIELKRNVAYILYGGIFIGLMCHVEYDYIFPQLFGTGHDVKTVVEEVLFDNFVSAPLMWLPPAYFIKAVMFDYPMKEGLDRYFTDIEEGLLMKYWAVWLPAQTISFSVCPDHLRIVFMACVSFCWFIVLTSLQSQTDNAAEAASAIETELATEAV